MQKQQRHPDRLTRRSFLESSASLAAAAVVARQLQPFAAATAEPAAAIDTRQASGIKVGEVTDNSAVVWIRVTAASSRNTAGPAVVGKVKSKKAGPITVPVAQLDGACPGAPGRVRLRYGTREDLSDAAGTGWADVSDATDFSHQHVLTGLKPSTTYYYAAETASPGDSPAHAPISGKFETAPPPDARTNMTFCVQTCQMYADLDHPEGFHIYPSMGKVGAKFVVFTGDNVYYDNEEPRAVSADLARYHWERMYSLPRHVELLRNVPGYWEKDDHDTLSDDSWPGMHMGQLTFAKGQEIFKQQVPIAPDGKPYRTFRWGKDLQIWLTDGRDYRSPNNIPDGPDKTIWGKTQKEWLKRTLAESDATWKVLVSPTPLVGPDRTKKNDNHSNAGFSHEGDEIRQWFKDNLPKDRFFVACGDRHWQYHSIHPGTGLREFSCGPASDQHASGTPGYNPAYHQFHRVKGGFLTVTVKEDAGKSSILFRHHDVMGKVVHEWGTTA